MPENPPSTERLQYLAGYFDGEGCIYASCNSKLNETPNVRIAIKSADLICLSRFVEGFGGTITNATMRRDGRQKRRLYSWSISGEKAQRALQQLRPFLITEKAQCADLALQFKIQRRGKVLIPEDEKVRRRALAKEITALNQRVTVQ